VIGALVAAVVGIQNVSAEAIAIAGVVAIPASTMSALAWRRAEHSFAGELVAAIALPGASAPVVVASGMSWQLAACIWAAWAVGYACSVIAVHRVIARHKRAPTRIDAIVGAALAAVTLAVVALVAWTPLAMVALPLAMAGTVLAINPPSARRLRAIGVALVIASVASGTIAIVAI
jgi:hypothetical protein